MFRNAGNTIPAMLAGTEAPFVHVFLRQATLVRVSLNK